jgi:curved DNA-binding protein CbpA
MSRNIRPGAGAFPPRPSRSRHNDGYNYTSDPGGRGGGDHYGKAGRNDYSRHGGDDGYYSQSHSSYGAGSNGRRDDGGYPDRSGYSRSNTNTLSTGSTTSTTSSSGSSLLGRMKVRSSDTSARTSIDDDSERMPARGGGWARKPPAVQENREREEELGTATHLESPAASTG